MANVKYLLIDESILPEVYSKVVLAKNLFASGEASSASAAAKMAGISRSAYYKYKDKIFEYASDTEDTTTLNAKLLDNAGVLSSVMNELYLAGANVLSVNQSIPVNNIADVSITVSMAGASVSDEDLAQRIRVINGVKIVEII